LITRRQILIGTLATAGVGGAVTVSGAVAAEAYRKGFAEASVAAQTKLAKSSIPWAGKHQAGIEGRPQAHTNFIALDLKPDIKKDDMLRWMVLLTDDIARLCAGQPALADPEPELIPGATNLTITVGFGPSLFEKLGIKDQMPAGFGNLPSFKIDALDDQFNDGDVLIHAAADDLQVLSHVTRTLIRDSATFASTRWIQSGFTNAVGTSAEGSTQRNLMGQVDGTDNPEFGSASFAEQVWIESGPAWVVGGTTLALRRIRMNLNTWDSLGRTDKEQVIGRNLHNGAPLGKQNERDTPDFLAKDESGLAVIPTFAHIRRASAENPQEQFFRRPFNYQVTGATNSELESGLLWTAYARDLSKQYVPVQKRLANFDLLNKWTTPVGSSVFAIARGVTGDEILAEELFS
jgi:dye decolorizing peroxidase